MKILSSEFKWLGTSRYSIYPGHNVYEVKQESIVFASSYLLEPELTYCYADLIEKLKKYFNPSDEVNTCPSSLQQYRNHLSALNGYLSLCGKTVDANIGVEMGSQFENLLRKYLAAIEVSARTKQDRASQLKTILRQYQALVAEGRNQKTVSTSFTIALREAVAKSELPPKTLAKKVGINPTTLSRWLNGAGLNKRGYSSLHRLEMSLNMERGTLVRLVGNKPLHDEKKTLVPSFRKRLRQRKTSALRLPESALNPQFIDEWNQLFSYKVDGFTLLNRTHKGVWRLIPSESSMTLTPLVSRRNMVCPSAAIVLEHIRSFLGVLIRLPSNEGGLSLPETAPQTLAWLAHPKALSLYLDWLTDRADGICHNGQRVFAQMAAGLLRKETGFLWQQPQVFRTRIPLGFRPESDEDWRKMCEQSYVYLRNFARNANGYSRSPFEPISNLLDSDEPLMPLLKAIELIDEDAAKCPPGGVTEARYKRDALLLALLVSNPLRKRSLASLTWFPDGSGSLRGSSSDGWRISLNEQQQKNGRSQRGRNYDVKVAEWVKPKLDAYIEEYRSTLLGKTQSNYLFVGDKNGGIWEGITKTVFKLTSKYIPGSPGFGPHGIRHLVATDWLRRYPGDYLSVAEILNDRIETVISAYAHLKRDDSFTKYETHLGKLLDRE